MPPNIMEIREMVGVVGWKVLFGAGGSHGILDPPKPVETTGLQ